MRIEDIIKPTSPMPIEKRTLLNVMFTQHVIAEKFNEILKPFEISAEQFNVLRILRGQRGNPVNMFTIQERMIAKTSNTTRLVDKLLLKEFVNREICLENRRKMEITITSKGLELLTQLDPVVEEHEKTFTSNLSKNEIELLNELLEKFRIKS